MNELDLFGGRGGPSSVIHVLADEAQKCHVSFAKFCVFVATIFFKIYSGYSSYDYFSITRKC